jgi:DNA-binding CsgD family transcriptional regulator
MNATRRLSAHQLADPAVRQAVFGFAEDAQRATSAAELDALMRREMAKFGPATFTFYVAMDHHRRPLAAKISGTSHVEWRRHYDASNFARTDDLLHPGLTSSAPMTWTRFRNERRLTRKRTRIYDEARTFGLKDGFYLPLHWADGSMLGVSAMAHETMPQDHASLAMLHMMALYYALAAERLGLTPPLRGTREAEGELTPRQIECLQWIAEGKSSWEIGEILDLSEFTVNEHLTAARRRLGAKTTTQAAVRAALKGLIRS